MHNFSSQMTANICVTGDSKVNGDICTTPQPTDIGRDSSSTDRRDQQHFQTTHPPRQKLWNMRHWDTMLLSDGLSHPQVLEWLEGWVWPIPYLSSTPRNANRLAWYDLPRTLQHTDLEWVLCSWLWPSPVTDCIWHPGSQSAYRRSVFEFLSLPFK